MTNKRFLLVIILASLLLSPLFGGLRREDVRVHKLENGLKILLLEDHTVPSVAYYTFFRVGSRNERVGLTGVSHFIEHMMFNGTKQLGPGAFDKTMEFAGGANNAYTGDDFTAYTDWFPPAGLEKIVAMEADRIQGLIFEPAVLEAERGVVASERRLSVENNNESLLEETVRATAIMAHPYHWDVIGWMSDIQNWKRDEVMQYYRTYYSPNNAVLVLVGDFNSENVLAVIKKYYSPIPAGAPPPAVTTVEPTQLGARRVEIRKPAQTPSFLLMYHEPPCTHADFAALRVLDITLLQGESSRLYRRLVRQEQLAVSVRGGAQETIDPFLFTIDVKPKAGADPARIEALIEEELGRIAREGISDSELQKAKNSLRTDFYTPLQTIAGRANLLGSSEMLYGGFEQLFELMKKLDAVTPASVKEVTGRYFIPTNKTVGILVPQGGAQ